VHVILICAQESWTPCAYIAIQLGGRNDTDYVQLCYIGHLEVRALGAAWKGSTARQAYEPCSLRKPKPNTVGPTRIMSSQQRCSKYEPPASCQRRCHETIRSLQLLQPLQVTACSHSFACKHAHVRGTGKCHSTLACTGKCHSILAWPDLSIC
jgi:hypothetical protein